MSDNSSTASSSVDLIRTSIEFDSTGQLRAVIEGVSADSSIPPPPPTEDEEPHVEGAIPAPPAPEEGVQVSAPGGPAESSESYESLASADDSIPPPPAAEDASSKRNSIVNIHFSPNATTNAEIVAAAQSSSVAAPSSSSSEVSTPARAKPTSADLNIFSPTRPPQTPDSQPAEAASSSSSSSVSSPPVRPPRPAALPYSRRQSLLAKSHLNFKTCMKHQFPLIDAQIASGQAIVKRVATFLKKVCESSESHAASILKLTQAEESKAETLRLTEAMTDHFKAVTQLTAAVEALAIRDQLFAQRVLADVVKPLLTWLPTAEDRRSKLVKEEKNTSSNLASKNQEADKVRISGVKLWTELLGLKKEKDKECQGGAKPSEKIVKKILKTKESAKKEFAKFEALKESVVQRNAEWRTNILPSILQSMEELEKERLVTLKKVLGSFASILKESVGEHPPQNLSIAHVVEQQVQLLNHAVDMNRFIENSVNNHGMPPVDPVIADLPCASTDLNPDSDRWEYYAPGATGANHGRTASGSVSHASANGVNGASEGQLASIREDDSATSSSAAAVAPASASSSAVTSPVKDSSNAEEEDDDDEEEGETLSTVSTTAINESWFIAQVDHPLPGAEGSSSASSSTAVSSSDVPLLQFSVDDIIRVTDRVSAGEGWWIGSNVGELNGKTGRFPKNLVRSVDDKYVETQPVSDSSEASAFDILRGKVSKKKKRFQQDGFDLDLTYILPNVIAMGFPSEGLEGTYRNPLPQVQKFFIKRHPENYKLYNLCSERWYDAAKFEGRVSRYPFDDHNPSHFSLVVPMMTDIYNHLHPNGVFDPKRVAAIHCKAGKGRTGFVICCFLLFLGLFPSYAPELALRFYAIKRTKNQKGVTIPAQIRYVMYFARWLRMDRGIYRFPRIPDRNPVLLQTIRLLGIPPATNRKDVWFKIVMSDGTKFSSKGRILAERRIAEDYIMFQGSSSSIGITSLDHDCHVTFYCGGMFDTTKLFQFWFNTRFIGQLDPGVENNEKEVEWDDSEPRRLVLNKSELDKACKDVHHKLYLDTFRVELVFTS